MAQMVRLLMREVRDLNPEPINSPTSHRCNLDVWALAQNRGVGHRSLVTPERVLSEYNEDLILIPYSLFRLFGFLGRGLPVAYQRGGASGGTRPGVQALGAQ